jgi:lipopolysaccharide/colanic/teichoic acid biosynthesis glycosyltransferase
VSCSVKTRRTDVVSTSQSAPAGSPDSAVERRIWQSAASDGDLLVAERAELNHRVQRALKRVLDIVLSAVGLVLMSPVMASIALAVKLDSPGPVLFRHRRIGRGGQPFNLYKFRSMTCSGDDTEYIDYLRRLIESEHGGDGEGLPYCKMEDDPRVTRVGEILRRYYLDEVPQLWNILKGDMSLVGPRPHVQFEVGYYTPQQRQRLTVRPGCAGLWQVAGKTDSTFSELIGLDLEYIDRWPLWLDLQILLKMAVLTLRGGEGVWTRAAKRIPGEKEGEWQ